MPPWQQQQQPPRQRAASPRTAPPNTLCNSFGTQQQQQLQQLQQGGVPVGMPPQQQQQAPEPDSATVEVRPPAPPQDQGCPGGAANEDDGGGTYSGGPLASPNDGTTAMIEEWQVFHTDADQRPHTCIVLPGRLIECQAKVPVHISKGTLEAFRAKDSHREAMHIGDFHPDCRDCYVAYTATQPQTHIYCSGYVVHLEEMCGVSMTKSTRVVPSSSPPPSARVKSGAVYQ
eukprot:GHVU01176759.1.p1 GENE.GHVU01176759.1~~GHVU01176759.1.p1  ORF type:complete len:230 (-),score=62.84 GHVU01176759.1:274-963(-)